MTFLKESVLEALERAGKPQKAAAMRLVVALTAQPGAAVLIRGIRRPYTAVALA